MQPTEFTKTASSMLQSPELQKLMPFILAGGLGATGGAMLTGKRRRSLGESRLKHIGRVLTNAALAGGLATAGTAAVVAGGNRLHNVASSAANEKISNIGPLESMARNVGTSPGAAAIAGGAGLYATRNNSGLGVNASREKALKLLKERLGKNSPSTELLSEMQPDDILKRVGNDPEKLRFARQAGLNLSTEGGMKGALARLMSAKGPVGNVLGHTRGMQGRRSLVGLAAASIPALTALTMTEGDRTDD